MINIHSKIFISGHKGMLWFLYFKNIKKKGYKNLVTIDKKIRFKRSIFSKKIY